MDSPFEILHVDPDADEDEIRRAYRRRAKETHPDQGGSRREFQRVKEAYEELTASGGGGDGDQYGPERPGRSRPPKPPEPPEPEGSLVTYLDYAVLDERGWNLDDEDLFEKAAGAGLSSELYGEFRVAGDDSLLEAAEDEGLTWPFSCRGGACANCAVAVVEGELEHFVDHVLSPELEERGIQLSCIGTPATDEVKVVFNVKDLPELEELQLPPRPG
ncbi:ferredoxin Fer [Haloarchaeobius sp. TZWWS8]|uniref:ferredoxin Fer n=1 Tax=Haloarchaeobius sp. TZWWS8 TaxID=3446121 RepID=UPI003EBB5CBB